VKEFLRPADAEILRKLPGMGGFSLSALVRLRLLRGLPTEVITLDPRATEPVELANGTFKYTICPRRSSGLGRTLFNREVRFLREAIRRSTADILHANWAYEYALAAVREPRPCLVTVRDHSLSVLRQLGWPYLPNFLATLLVSRRAKHLSAVSPYNAAFVRKISRKTVHIVPNCASPKCLEMGDGLFAKNDLFSKGLTIASAISAVSYKNPRSALEAFAQVRRTVPAARYLLMGPGLDAGGEIAAWAQDRGMAAGVEFLGNRSHDEVLNYFAESDIILHPSLEEACSSTVVEAMALGKPIVADRSGGGTPWVLDDGKAGVLADARSPAELAGAILKLYENRALAVKLGRCGFERARGVFSPDAVLQAYEMIYSEILGEAKT
jgi:glycosyltransferase involved in cell wall biosynthesis